METISKRKKLIPFLIYMLLTVTILVLLNGKSDHRHPPIFLLSEKELSVLRIGAILFSLFALIAPWHGERLHLPLLRKNLAPGRISHEARFLLFSYASLYSPALFGMVLYQSFGFPIIQANYFMGASILGMIVWYIYTLRKNATW